MKLNVNDISESVDKYLSLNGKEALEGAKTVDIHAAYLHIELLQSIYGDSMRIYNTAHKLRVVFEIPENFLPGKGIDRSYQLIYLQPGESTVPNPVTVTGAVDLKAKTVAFELDAFDIPALLTYNDVIVEVSDSADADSPDTGDSLLTVLFVLIAGSLSFGVMLLMQKKRRGL